MQTRSIIWSKEPLSIYDGGTWHRSENVAFDAVSCATVPVLSEGGPAKWLKNKNLSNHLCDYEPGGREFESLRAHHFQIH